MKHYEGNYFQAVALDGSHKLDYTTERLEDLKRHIDESNSRAKKQGYKPQKWAITFLTWQSVYSDNGEFISQSSAETVVEKYPEKL